MFIQSIHALAPLLLALAIGQTADVGDGDGEDTGAAEEGLGIAEAGEAFLASLSAEERARPFEGAAPIDDDEGTETPAKPAKPSSGAPAKSDAPAKPAAKADAVEGEEEEDGKPVLVVLPGETDRGEEDIEVEVEPELAERIQRLKNEGLRAADFKARSERIDAQAARIADYTEHMDADPIGFHLQHMPADKQLDVARALILEHLEVLAPEIDGYLADPKKLYEARNKQLTDRRTAETQLATTRQVRAATAAIMKQVEALVPSGTDATTMEDFIADARQDLGRAAKSGERVEPGTVKRLLARRLQRYGFDKPAAPRVPAKPAKGKDGARPVSDQARKTAEAAAPTRSAAAEAQARIRRAAVARSAASRVAPPGAGAAPVQLPAVPKEAETDIASMSKHLRGSGLPASWSTPKD